MFIGASRRTDIPAFYSEWFMNKIEIGFCKTINPFNAKQIKTVSLKPKDVDAIVFWTKNPEPMLKYINKLENIGYRYYFQFTLNDYPKELEPKVPIVTERIATFKKLSEMIGKQRVIWRYDPIIFSNVTDLNYHKEV